MKYFIFIFSFLLFSINLHAANNSYSECVRQLDKVKTITGNFPDLIYLKSDGTIASGWSDAEVKYKTNTPEKKDIKITSSSDSAGTEVIMDFKDGHLKRLVTDYKDPKSVVVFFNPDCSIDMVKNSTSTIYDAKMCNRIKKLSKEKIQECSDVLQTIVPYEKSGASSVYLKEAIETYSNCAIMGDWNKESAKGRRSSPAPATSTVR